MELTPVDLADVRRTAEEAVQPDPFSDDVLALLDAYGILHKSVRTYCDDQPWSELHDALSAALALVTPEESP